jgi:ankyrin repeat protein
MRIIKIQNLLGNFPVFYTKYKSREKNMLEQDLAYAVSDDDIAKVRLLLLLFNMKKLLTCNFVASLDTICTRGRDPLLVNAAYNNFIGIVDLLIRAGADVDKVKSDIGATPLWCASQEGHTQVVAQLIQADADVDKPLTTDGQTPLYVASLKGHTEIVTQLIQVEADVDKPLTTDGQTPLYAASCNGRTEVVAQLIQADADVDKPLTTDGQTPLYAASCKGHAQVVTQLIQARADVDKALTTDGQTPLYVASWQGYAEIVAKLIQAEADVDKAETTSGQTPLYRASQEGHAQVVTQLTQADADVDKPLTTDGQTPLYRASCDGHTEIVAQLIQTDADVDKPLTTDGQTPLYAASCNGHTQVVAKLIQADADVDKALTTTGQTPLYVASWQGYAEIVAKLIQAEADVDKAETTSGQTPLYRASQEGHAQVVTQLIQARADVDKALTTDGQTPLYVASMQGHAEVVAKLTQADADVDKTKNNGQTPLYVASMQGHAEVVAKLIQAGADVDKARTLDGATPLYTASCNGHTQIVAKLIQAEADVDKAETDDSKTPLRIATASGHIDVVKLLVENGAKIDTQAKDRSTPISSARLNKHPEIADFLSELLRKPIADVDTSRQQKALEFERQKLELQREALELEKQKLELQRQAATERTAAEKTATDDKPRTIRPTITPSDTQALLAQYAAPSAPGLISQPSSDATEEIVASRQTELMQPKTPPAPRAETSGMQVSFNISYADLTFGQQIGEGGFGNVFSGTCRTFGQVAIKQFKGKDLQQILGLTSFQAFMHEAEMMSRIRHPNIVSLWGISDNSEHQYSMVMEYMPKGSLYDVIHDDAVVLNWQQRWQTALEIGYGMCFLHEQEILHHDLKSPNVLLDEKLHAKISDFGLSRINPAPGSSPSHMASQTLCDFRWKAPELTESKARYTKQADVFSYGIILWELATGKVPSGGKPRKKTIPADCPPNFKETIRRCWRTRPEDRCTIQKAVQDLEANKSDVGLTR